MSHGRLAFCSATKILLAVISWAAGSTDTTSRKSAIEEKVIWKVTPCSALIFSAKDICKMNATSLVYFHL